MSFTNIRTIFRLIGILAILARYDAELLSQRFWPLRLLTWVVGLLPWIRRERRMLSPSVRMRTILEELGPTFIKFGQALSTRMDALPEEIGLELKKLQDKVPPFPIETVRKIIAEDLDGPVEHHFVQFDPIPVASASMAQVHRAITRDGQDVAVKVMRPNVESVVEQDIRMLTALANLIDAHVPEWQRFQARRVVDEFAATIRNEMNFLVEGGRAQKFRDHFKQDPEMHALAVIWPLTTRRVLTMEWCDGIPIDELSNHPELGLNAEKISRNIITSFFKQVFRDGFFHADQHPGNIFVRPDGTLTILDFGIIGRVSMRDRVLLAELMRGFLDRNYRKVAEVHLTAGFVPRHTNLDEFEDACRQIGEPIFGQPLKEISIAKLLAQLFKVTEQFDMPVQPQLLLLQKTMFTLEGVGREINPDLNMWVLAEPLIRDWMMEHLGPLGKVREMGERVKKINDSAAMIPDLLFNGLERLATDRVRLHIHASSLARLERRVGVGFQRQAAAITGGTLFIGAAIMVAAGLSVWWYVPPFVLAALYFMRGMRSVR
ncbi:MAG: 2-polyprenylphenol 6-hydroxylase [Magnetococcales bacterium]|nr:2-polyprenylphenol 6-hydroxylase [Magnetococcales bacterium]NGZ07049.1 2-polyprenylphenol 6-hydroxylase [Magnetococcales bacterium]